MPSRRIVWIKLEKRLLNDYRFYGMSDKSKLLYVQLLLLAAETANKIPKNPEIIKSCIRCSWETKEVESCIQEIMRSFPKFRCKNELYCFRDFNENHNYVWKREVQRNAHGVPRDGLDKIRGEGDKKERREEDGLPEVPKIKMDFVFNKYINIKGIDKSSLSRYDFARFYSAIKNLLIRASSDEKLVEFGLSWIAQQKYSWTLETLLKKFPEFEGEFVKIKGFRELEEKYGKELK